MTLPSLTLWRRWTTRLVLAVALLAAPMTAAAQDDEKLPDARLVNYPRSVTLEEGSVALSWILLLVLAAVCAGVMMKDAKRSHLD